MHFRMINFFKNHKNKRSDIEICEDSKTSTVFEILSIFPNNSLWEILRNSASIDISIEPGDFQDIQFWPKWNPHKTSNSQFVEPDVFIQFSKLDIIIEAKINNSNPQSTIQWSNEILAHCNEYGYTHQFILIAVDGNSGSNGKEEVSFATPDSFIGVYKTDWNTIVNEVRNNERLPEYLKSYFEKALSLFGHSHYESFGQFFSNWQGWLETCINPSKMRKSYELLRNIKI